MGKKDAAGNGRAFLIGICASANDSTIILQWDGLTFRSNLQSHDCFVVEFQVYAHGADSEGSNEAGHKSARATCIVSFRGKLDPASVSTLGQTIHYRPFARVGSCGTINLRISLTVLLEL